MTTATLDLTLDPCTTCHGDGWADPWDAFGGAPPLTWCRACLGAGLEDCDGCDGYGSVPEPVGCPGCGEALHVV